MIMNFNSIRIGKYLFSFHGWTLFSIHYLTKDENDLFWKDQWQRKI